MACESAKSPAALFREAEPRMALSTGCLELEQEDQGDVDFFLEAPTEREKRWEIIAAYLKILEECPSPLRQESLLPFPKELIERAIWQELEENPESECRNDLEIAYAHIDSFLPADEFELIENFKQASLLAQDREQTADPGNIIVLARILKQAEGEKAVSIQERISERIRNRFNRIRKIRDALHRARPCHIWS